MSYSWENLGDYGLVGIYVGPQACSRIMTNNSAAIFGTEADANELECLGRVDTFNA